MRIGIIGAGKIGDTIGAKWEAAGHEVVYGLRDPSKKKGGVTLDRAVRTGDVVLLAIPGDAVVDFVRHHAGSLDGKVVIDATNNLRGAAMNSCAEITVALPRAQLYRAFNTYGWDVSANPMVGAEEVDMFYAGPDGAAQAAVEQLISDVGFRPIRVGGLDQVGTVDGVLRLWYVLAQTRGRRIAFKLVAD